MHEVRTIIIEGFLRIYGALIEFKMLVRKSLMLTDSMCTVVPDHNREVPVSQLVPDADSHYVIIYIAGNQNGPIVSSKKCVSLNVLESNASSIDNGTLAHCASGDCGFVFIHHLVAERNAPLPACHLH